MGCRASLRVGAVLNSSSLRQLVGGNVIFVGWCGCHLPVSSVPWHG